MSLCKLDVSVVLKANCRCMYHCMLSVTTNGLEIRIVSAAMCGERKKSTFFPPPFFLLFFHSNSSFCQTLASGWHAVTHFQKCLSCCFFFFLFWLLCFIGRLYFFVFFVVVFLQFWLLFYQDGKSHKQMQLLDNMHSQGECSWTGSWQKIRVKVRLKVKLNSE